MTQITIGRAKPTGATWIDRNKVQLCTLGIVVLLYAIFIAVKPSTYLSFDIYRSFMISIPFYGIMALSATLVITLGEIDLSFPSIYGLAGWVFAATFSATASFPLALVGCLLCGTVAGAINGLLVTKIRIPSIVATIGTMFLWRGLVNVLTQGRGIPLSSVGDSPLSELFVGHLFEIVPAQFIWFLGCAVVLGLVYKRHRFGSHVLFVGDNRDSARMMGINVDRVTILCFAQLGFFAALSSVFLLNQMLFFWATTGEGYLLTTLAAVFIGGTSVFGGKGTMIGTVIGVFIIASLEPGIIAVGLTGFWTQFIYGLLITVSVSIYALMLRKPS
jgi:simple sugar transport system permease protein